MTKTHALLSQRDSASNLTNYIIIVISEIVIVINVTNQHTIRTTTLILVNFALKLNCDMQALP